MRTIWNEKELEFIRNNYQDMTYKEVAIRLNQFNDIKKDGKQVRTKACVMGLSKAKYIFNKEFFKTIDTEEKAYWLGFMYADGYIVRHEASGSSEVSIQLSKVDESHLKKFNKHIDGNFNVGTKVGKDRHIKGVFVKGGAEFSIIRIYSGGMFKDLVDKGVVQNKTYEPEFPKVEGDMFNHFLRGYMDGDGCISKSKKGTWTLSFTCSNEAFLLYLREELTSRLNLQLKINIYREEEWKLRMSINNKQDLRVVLDYIYKDSKISMDRKFAKYQDFKLGSPH